MAIFDGVSTLDTGCWGVFHGGKFGVFLVCNFLWAYKKTYNLCVKQML